MASEADICNLALMRIGQRQTIQSLTDDELPARLCAAAYPLARDAMLQAAPWPWATKHLVLAQLTVTRDGWDYAYQVPKDCLDARYLYSGVRPGASLVSFAAVDQCYPRVVSGAATEVPFAIEASDDLTGRILLTDLSPATLVYTAAITAPTAFPPLFVQALAWRLAVDLSLSFATKPQLASAAENKANEVFAEALAAAFREGHEDPKPDASFLAVRR